MATTTANAIGTARDTTDLRDPLYRIGRGALYLGLFFSSMLVLRANAITIGDMLLIASIALALVARLLNQDRAWPESYYSAGSVILTAILMVVGASLSIANAVDPGESSSIIARLLLVAFVLPWLARTLLPEGRHLARAAGWLVAGAVLSAAGTLLQFQFGAEVIPGGDVTGAGRFSGFTGHVSDLGGVAAMGLALALGYVIAKGHRFIGLVAVAVLAVGLILSGSVSGMAASAVALLVYVIRGQMKIRYAFLLAVAGLFVVWAVSAVQSSVSALSPIERIMQTLGITESGRYSTSDIRADTYAVAFDKIIASPFIGHGFDSVSWVVDGTFPAHNLIIGALFQGGVLVAVALLVMILRPLTGRWLRQDKSVLTTQLLASVAAGVTFAMTAPSLYNRYFWLPIALLGVARTIQIARARQES